VTWDYSKLKKNCAVCGADAGSTAQVIALCFQCTTYWLESPERAEAATARARFVERMKKEQAVKEKKA
jgi:hypothetical protein